MFWLICIFTFRSLPTLDSVLKFRASLQYRCKKSASHLNKWGMMSLLFVLMPLSWMSAVPAGLACCWFWQRIWNVIEACQTGCVSTGTQLSLSVHANPNSLSVRQLKLYLRVLVHNSHILMHYHTFPKRKIGVGNGL